MWFGLFELPLLLLSIILFAIFCGMIALVEDERPWGATFLTLLTVALLHLSGVINVIDVFRQPLLAIGVIVSYLVVGVVWALIKWRFYVAKWRRSQLEALGEAKETFQASRNSATAVYTYNTFDEYLKHSRYSFGKALQVRDHVSSLLVWSSYWPFSLLWTVVDDPLRRFYQYVLVHILGKSLQKLANSESERVNREMQSLINAVDSKNQNTSAGEQ